MDVQWAFVTLSLGLLDLGADLGGAGRAEWFGRFVLPAFRWE